VYNSLTLHNFKAFRDITIPIKPLTLLSGLNGSGKSTTLQALALLRQSWDTGFLHQQGLLLNGDLIVLGTGVDVLHDQHEDEEIGITLHTGKTEFAYRVAYNPSGDLLHFSSPLKFDFFSGLEQTRGLFGNCFQYLRADRASPDVSFPKAYHLVSERKFLGSRGEYTAHFLTLFRDEEVDPRLRHPKDSAPGLLSQVNAWMKEFSPGVSLEVEDIPRTDSVRLDYFYGGTAGISSSNAYRSTNVGFGLTYVLPVLVACLASPPQSWLLIENPEAHLHPQGQAAIGQLLARSAGTGTRILVESHSDHVLNGLRLAVKNGDIPAHDVSLSFFRRDSGSGQPDRAEPTITDAGRISSWPDGFFDQWDKSLDQLLG
jgi:predicted ATPase